MRAIADGFLTGFNLFLVVAVLTSCSGPSETIIIEKKNVIVKIVPYLKEPGYDHPVELSVKVVAKALNSLVFSQFEFFHWGEEEQVLRQEMIDQCAAPIAEAFQRASATERVRFTVVERFKQLIFAHDVVTTAEGFCKGDELHLIFLQLKDEFLPDGAGGPDGSAFSPGRDWKFIVGPGQRLETGKRTFAGTSASSKQCIIIDLSQIDRIEKRNVGAVEQVGGDEGEMEKREESRTVDVPGEEGTLTDEIIEKLRALKTMREEGLITEEEYQRKKAEILDKM